MAKLATEFASAERADTDDVLREWKYFDTDSPIATLLNLVPEVVLILNRQRQVVFANRAALQYTGALEIENVLGKRPGELLHCRHSHETEGGCGTTPFCRYCGAVNAILESQDDKQASEECHVNAMNEGSEEALDVRVWARPMKVQDENFTFFALADIADEKRREVLERIFLHDIMNTATALKGFSWLLNTSVENYQLNRSYSDRIAALTERMIDEIQAHRQLLAAEKGELKPNVDGVNSYVLLQEIFLAYCRPDVLERRVLRLEEESEAIGFQSDPILLRRVLGNMVKNAIEASSPGDMIRMGCFGDGGEVVFWVNNPACMPENVRMQIFNRSFSTKGPGRGIGTYSIKYLSEKYLGGHVYFTSTEKDGTTFEARYPVQWRGGLPH